MRAGAAGEMASMMSLAGETRGRRGTLEEWE